VNKPVKISDNASHKPPYLRGIRDGAEPETYPCAPKAVWELRTGFCSEATGHGGEEGIAVGVSILCPRDNGGGDGDKDIQNPFTVNTLRNQYTISLKATFADMEASSADMSGAFADT
jgi:hypothetical protein